jgi:hypothetical protein
MLWSFAFLILFGLALSGASQIVASIIHSRASGALHHIETLSNFSGKGLNEPPQGETITIPKTVLIETLESLDRKKSVADWFQNSGPRRTEWVRSGLLSGRRAA